MDEIRHLSFAELEAGLDSIRQAPADNGRLEGIVARPRVNERTILEEGRLSPESGLEGDAWAQGCWLELENGSPHPDVQIAITGSRTMSLIAQHRSRWPLAGDQLYADLDLSFANLPIGQRLGIGSAVLQVTDQPHLGCKKFAERFGQPALAFVNSTAGRPLRLRGVYCRVIEPGTISVGDAIGKL